MNRASSAADKSQPRVVEYGTIGVNRSSWLSPSTEPSFLRESRESGQLETGDAETASYFWSCSPVFTTRFSIWRSLHTMKAMIAAAATNSMYRSTPHRQQCKQKGAHHNDDNNTILKKYE